MNLKLMSKCPCVGVCVCVSRNYSPNLVYVVKDIAPLDHEALCAVLSFPLAYCQPGSLEQRKSRAPTMGQRNET